MDTKIDPKPPTNDPDKLRRAAAIILYAAGVTDLSKITPDQKATIAAGLYMVDPDNPNFVMPDNGKRASGFVRINTGANGCAFIRRNTVMLRYGDDVPYNVSKDGSYGEANAVPVESRHAGVHGNAKSGTVMRFEKAPPGAAVDVVVGAEGIGGGEDPVCCDLRGDHLVGDLLGEITWRSEPNAHVIGAMIGLKQPECPSWVRVGEYVWIPNIGRSGRNMRVVMVSESFVWLEGGRCRTIGYVKAHYLPSSEAPRRTGIPCSGCGEAPDDYPHEDPCRACAKKHETETTAALDAQLAFNTSSGNLTTARAAAVDVLKFGASVDENGSYPGSFAGIRYVASSEQVSCGLRDHHHAFSHAAMALSASTAEEGGEDSRKRRPYEVEVQITRYPDAGGGMQGLLDTFESGGTHMLVTSKRGAMRAFATSWDNRRGSDVLRVTFQEDMAESAPA